MAVTTRKSKARQPSQTAMDTEQLWARYDTYRDPADKKQLGEIYLPIIKYQAERMSARLPDNAIVEDCDLMSAGYFGLDDAIDAFDLSRGVKFETYCAPRIIGAMLDELRVIDHLPRSMRKIENRLEDYQQKLANENRQQPSYEQLVQRIGEDTYKTIKQGEKKLKEAKSKLKTELTPQLIKSQLKYALEQPEVLADEVGPGIFKQINAQSNLLEKVSSDLQAKLKRKPTESQVIYELGERIYEGIDKATGEIPKVVSLSKKVSETEHRTVRLADVLGDELAQDSSLNQQKRDFWRFVTKGLSDQERLLLILYYQEEQTMKQIGETLKSSQGGSKGDHMSESRISQMNTALELRLKQAIEQRIKVQGLSLQDILPSTKAA